MFNLRIVCCLLCISSEQFFALAPLFLHFDFFAKPIDYLLMICLCQSFHCSWYFVVVVLMF